MGGRKDLDDKSVIILYFLPDVLVTNELPVCYNVGEKNIKLLLR